MTKIKGQFASSYSHYEYDCIWEGHLIYEEGDRDTPGLYIAIVDAVDITGCYDTDDEQLLCVWPGEIDELAAADAQEHADNGDYICIHS